jgi:HAD superfamily hydrolase (TIGR01509 family)
MIKCVVFDLGKVLLDFDYSIAARKVAARAKMSAADIKFALDHSPLLYTLERGEMTPREFHRAVAELTGFAGDFEEFQGHFSDIFSPIEPMIQLNESLRRRGLPTFIFSNTNDMAVPHIRRQYPFFASFDGYVLSYEHGVMKPDARLYEIVEGVTGKRGAEILYIDDRPENIAAGVARGWQAIVQENPQKTIAAVRDLGLLGT